MRPANDLTGRTFGRLKVVTRAGSDERGKALWKCICDCGETAVIVGYSLTRGDTQSCGCLVGLVASTRPSALYGGLTLTEHAARSGISSSTLDKRVRKYGEPFPPHLNKTRAEQELQVFEQDRENGKRTYSRRIGRAAAWHQKDGIAPAPDPLAASSEGTNEHRAEFAEQDASQAAAEHRADSVELRGPMHTRWGFDPGPSVRPSWKDRGLR